MNKRTGTTQEQEQELHKNKQAQELIFSHKVQTTNPPPLFFN